MIQLQVPPELSDLMLSEGVAIRPTSRASAWEITVTGLSSASVVISLLQAPDTFGRLARILKDAIGGRTDATIEIKANGRRSTIHVAGDSDLEQLTRKIRESLDDED